MQPIADWQARNAPSGYSVPTYGSAFNELATPLIPCADNWQDQRCNGLCHQLLQQTDDRPPPRKYRCLCTHTLSRIESTDVVSWQWQTKERTTAMITSSTGTGVLSQGRYCTQSFLSSISKAGCSREGQTSSSAHVVQDRARLQSTSKSTSRTGRTNRGHWGGHLVRDCEG